MRIVEKLEESNLGVKEGEEWCGVLLYADNNYCHAPKELKRMTDSVE